MSFSTIAYYLRQPLYQPVFFLVLTILLVPFLKAKTANASWNVAGLMYLGYVLTNVIFCWSAESTWMYFFISLVISVAYVLLVGTIVSFLISVLKINGSGESATIFLFVIYHPVVLLGVIVLRWIIRSIG